ncbi:HAD-IC family P-type ATPase [Nitrososphaera sp.]|uniref:HAD-IC family P-type ATPase n=1 Tax=Nitrososphaera sp. TaxID=1971748 RepID=UPI003180C518
MKDWHAVSVEETEASLETDIHTGLSEEEVRLRQEKFGLNTITARRRKHPLLRFALQFREPLMYILVLAGIVTAFLEEWVDSGVIFGVVVVNAAVGFVQETRAGKALEALVRMVTTEATVVRSRVKKRISSTELVPGDIVMVRSGDKVPADLRLFRSRELQIDESALTGESVAVEKKTDVLKLSTVLADRKNMAYSGTLVASGQGTGVVVATGDRTQTGQISESISAVQEIATPFTRKIAKFSKVLLYFIIVLSAAAFVVGVARNDSALEETFLYAVALAVAAIPEGLPAAITITLAIGVSRMAKRHAIIRKLPAVETLGSTTVICSDKTGTLTENQMTVAEIYAGRTAYKVSGTGYQPEGTVTREDGKDLQNDKSLGECLAAGLLCNDSHLILEDDRWESSGDPTEVALIVSARKAGLSEGDVGMHFPRIDAIPFESHLQYMATLHEAGNKNVVYVKGAVEKVSQMCTFLAIGGQAGLTETRMTTDDVEEILGKAREMGRKGLRVLAFARKDVSSAKKALAADDVDSGFVFLGLQAMLDPPRQDAVTAVQTCQRAGIKVKMITGDNVHTATIIAQQIGLNNHLKDGDRDAIVAVTGYELQEYSESELADVVERANVFARVSPEQKLQLVKYLQAKGHVVAVTGDGVNDAPALKQADIGIAMGIRGTEVAKEAADMVLTDDNFASIESAVEEGRGIFDNLTKFITWTLPTNFGETLIIITAIFAGLTLPMLPVQILWINMTTALALGMMLIFEPKEADIMRRKPRKPDAPILGRVMVERIILVSGMILVGVFGLFVWEQSNGASLDEARTVAVNAIIMIELFYLLNSRSLSSSMFKIGVFSNKWVVIGIALMIALQMAYTYIPTMNVLFKSSPISLESWIKILGVAFLTCIIVEIEKWMLRKITRRRTERTAEPGESA